MIFIIIFLQLIVIWCILVGGLFILSGFDIVSDRNIKKWWKEFLFCVLCGPVGWIGYFVILVERIDDHINIISKISDKVMYWFKN
jgi:hypothetical protein